MKVKGEKERYTHLNAELQRIARRDKKDFLRDQCKEIEKNNRMGKMKDLFKKLEKPREYFMQRWTQNKGQKIVDLTEQNRLRRGDKNAQNYTHTKMF